MNSKIVIQEFKNKPIYTRIRDYNGEFKVFKDNIEIDVCPEGEQSVFLYTGEYWRELLGSYIFDDDEKVKYSRIYKLVRFIRKKPCCMYYKDLIVFNKTTHRLYYIQHKYFAGSQILRKIYKQSICDITYKGFLYNCNDDDPEALDYFNNVIKKIYGQDYTYTLKDVENINSHSYRSHDSKSITRIFLYIQEQLNIKNNYLVNFIFQLLLHDTKIISKLKGKTEKEILSYLKVNRKMLAKSNYLLDYYLLVFDYLENVNDSIEALNKDIWFFCKNPYGHLKRKNFLYQYYKYNSKKKLLNQAEKYINFVYDCCSMYYYNATHIKGYKLDFANNNFKYLHDILSKDNARLKAAETSKKIPKNKDIEKIFDNFVCNDIRYVPAKETGELIITGSHMNICVGSYAERAVRKQCYIVIGYDKEDNPVTCIELRKNNENKYSVYQVKKHNNNYPKKEESNSLIHLFIEHDVNIATKDLINAKQEESTEAFVAI